MGEITPRIFMWIVGILLTVILSMVGFIVGFILKSQKESQSALKDTVDGMKNDSKEYKQEMKDKMHEIQNAQDLIKQNYLLRFETVNKNIHDMKIEVIGKMSEIRELIIENKP